MPKLLLFENREVCDSAAINTDSDLVLGVVSVPQTPLVCVQVPCSIFEGKRSPGGSMWFIPWCSPSSSRSPSRLSRLPQRILLYSMRRNTPTMHSVAQHHSQRFPSINHPSWSPSSQCPVWIDPRNGTNTAYFVRFYICIEEWRPTWLLGPLSAEQRHTIFFAFPERSFEVQGKYLRRNIQFVANQCSRHVHWGFLRRASKSQERFVSLYIQWPRCCCPSILSYQPWRRRLVTFYVWFILY